MSFHYLEMAINIAYEINDKKKAAEVHLNTSTILSHVGKYKLAAEQCLASIILLQEYINENMNKKEDFEENLTLLVLSYRNLAVQHENLGSFSQSLLFYQIAEDLIKRNKEKYNIRVLQMVDDAYKLKLVSKSGEEKRENKDKIGLYFHKMYLNSICKNLEEKIAEDKIKIEAETFEGIKECEDALEGTGSNEKFEQKKGNEEKIEVAEKTNYMNESLEKENKLQNIENQNENNESHISKNSHISNISKNTNPNPPENLEEKINSSISNDNSNSNINNK